MGVPGERAFFPNSEEMGIIVPAFQSWYFGFSMEFTAEDLEKVNRKIARDVHYFDRIADQYVNEHSKTNTLLSHNFLECWSMV